jgi:hydrogenase maturation protein HypF
MADNGLSAPLLGIAWDGSGWGGDGTVWGGEFLRVEQRGHARLAHLWPFALPGGEAAVREPRRAALGVLHALYGARAFEMTELAPVAAFDRGERAVLARMIERGLNTPQTSSAGRVFDAAAALLDLCQAATFDGEAGMAVEAAAERAAQPAPLPPVVLVPMEDGIRVDWRPMMRALIESLGVRSAESLAAGLHEGFAQAMVAVAERAGLARVALTGGCFQNARLTERAVVLLRAAGFEPHWHHRIPPNDGGLAAGQIAYAAAAFGLEGTASPKARAE